MARESLATAQSLVETILNEQQHDRDLLQGMLNHSHRMIESLQSLLEREDQKLETEFQKKKAAARKLFRELISNEEERSDMLSDQLAAVEGQPNISQIVADGVTKPKLADAVGESSSPDVDNQEGESLEQQCVS